VLAEEKDNTPGDCCAAECQSGLSRPYGGRPRLQ